MANLKKDLKKRYKRCRACNKKGELQFHHLIPESRLKKNLIPLCPECHKKFHNYWDNKVIERTQKIINLFKQQMFDAHLLRNNHQLIFNKFADFKKEVKQELAKLKEAGKRNDMK